MRMSSPTPSRSIDTEFVQLVGAIGEFLRIGAHGLRHFGDLFLAVRQEFMQQQIEKTDRWLAGCTVSKSSTSSPNRQYSG